MWCGSMHHKVPLFGHLLVFCIRHVWHAEVGCRYIQRRMALHEYVQGHTCRCTCRWQQQWQQDGLCRSVVCKASKVLDFSLHFVPLAKGAFLMSSRCSTSPAALPETFIAPFACNLYSSFARCLFAFVVHVWFQSFMAVQLHCFCAGA
jgi:hypothetical protein